MKSIIIQIKPRIYTYIGIGSFLILAFTNSFGQIPDSETRSLMPNQTIEREMTGAETHRYKFDLKANEFFQVRVDQKGVDVALKLLDENGKTLAMMDSPAERFNFGLEILSFVPTKSGFYMLFISGFESKKDEQGTYVIKRETSRTATEKDKRRVEIEKVFIQAVDARYGSNRQDKEALAKFEEALAGWRELNDEYLIKLTANQINQLKKTKADLIVKEAYALFTQGTSESYRAALEKFQAANRIYGEISDKSEDAGISLLASGSIYDRLGEKAAALQFYGKALLLFRSGENKNWIAITFVIT